MKEKCLKKNFDVAWLRQGGAGQADYLVQTNDGLADGRRLKNSPVRQFASVLRGTLNFV